MVPSIRWVSLVSLWGGAYRQGFEAELRSTLANRTDVLLQIRVSGRENLSLREFEPVFSSGAGELLAILNALNQQLDQEML